jgi:sugar lactone lactonase YvrE
VNYLGICYSFISVIGTNRAKGGIMKPVVTLFILAFALMMTACSSGGTDVTYGEAVNASILSGGMLGVINVNQNGTQDVSTKLSQHLKKTTDRIYGPLMATGSDSGTDTFSDGPYATCTGTWSYQYDDGATSGVFQLTYDYSAKCSCAGGTSYNVAFEMTGTGTPTSGSIKTTGSSTGSCQVPCPEYTGCNEYCTTNLTVSLDGDFSLDLSVDASGGKGDFIMSGTNNFKTDLVDLSLPYELSSEYDASTGTFSELTGYVGTKDMSLQDFLEAAASGASKGCVDPTSDDPTLGDSNQFSGSDTWDISSHVSFPEGIWATPSQVLVADQHDVKVFNASTGAYVATIGQEATTTTTPPLPGHLKDIEGLAVDSDGNIHVLCPSQDVIHLFDENRVASKVYGSANIYNSFGLYARGKTIYVADMGNHGITIFSNDGNYQGFVDTQTEVYTPGDVVVDSSGNFYVTGVINNHEVAKYNSAGTFIKKFIGMTQVPHNSQMGIDSADNLYVGVNYSRYRVDIFDNSDAFLGDVGGDEGLTLIRGISSNGTHLYILWENRGSATITKYAH